MGHAYANYFNKAYIVSYKKWQKRKQKKKKKKKKKKHRLISWQNPIKIKRISVPYLLQAQLQ